MTPQGLVSSLALVISCVHVVTTGFEIGNSRDYKITTFKKSNGLFFEELQPVRTFHTQWKLVTSLDISALLSQKPDIETFYKEGLEQCHDTPLPCDSAEETLARLRQKLDQTNRFAQLLKGTTGELNSNSRMKRSAPLGFIGSLSHTLFGTLSEDDANFYNAQLNKIHYEQKRMASLISNQTHIIRSEFSNIHLNLENLTKQAIIFSRETNNLAEALKAEADYSRLQFYKLALTRWLYTLEQAVNEYSTGIVLLTDAVLFARQGTIHPAILSPQQLATASKEIRQNSQYEFPLTYEELYAENINEVAHLDLSYSRGRLLLLITVPLLDRSPFTMYQVYPCPTKQSINKNTTAISYIQPRTPYVALSMDKSHYFLPDMDYLKGCKIHKRQFLCQLTLPLNDVSSKPTCETSLLLNNQEITWSTCDIRLVSAVGTYWQRLQMQDAWLYSTAKDQEISIFCDGHNAGYEKLNGAGILQLRGGCTASTGSTKLTALQIFTSNKSYQYEPILSLNLSFISPSLKNMKINELLKVNKLPDKEPSTNWDSSENGIKLANLEAQAREMEEDEDDSREMRMITYSTIGGSSTILLIAIVICVILYCKGKKPIVARTTVDHPINVSTTRKRVTFAPDISRPMPINEPPPLPQEGPAIELQTFPPAPSVTQLEHSTNYNMWASECRI